MFCSRAIEIKNREGVKHYVVLSLLLYICSDVLLLLKLAIGVITDYEETEAFVTV